MNPVLLVVLFVVSAVLGYLIIRNVPALLHTPLMSGMNALSGITVLGAIIACFQSRGVLALILKAMWGMYKKCKKTVPAYLVMAAAFVLVAFVKVPVIAVIIGCAVFGIVTFFAMEKEGKK